MAQIFSREITGPSGDTRRVQIGSKAESKYFAQGYTPVTEAPTSSRTGEEVSKETIQTAYSRGRIDDESASALSQLYGSPLDSLTSSSSSLRAEESQIKSDLNNLSPTSVGEARLRSASDAYIAEIDSQIKQLESQREGDLAGINARFDDTRRQTEDAQVREKGSTTVSLARIGGYLGQSASGIGAMLNLAQTHKQEILSLEQKRNSALTEANNLYNERRFDLVKEKLSEAKQIEKDILERKDKFFEQTLDLSRARQQEDEFFREKYTDRLESLSLLDADEVDPAALKEIDQYYGVEGFASRYLDVTRSANEAKSAQAQLDSQKKLLDLLKDIPNGQTVRFPDGTEYTGMGSAGDVTTSLQVDSDGIGRIVAYNKLTGATNITNVGSVGKKSSSGNSPSSVDPTERDNVVGMLQIRLEDSKMEDGTYDPDTYLEERKLIKEAYPQLVQYVDNLYLNQSYGFFNDEAIVRLRKKGVYYGDQPLLGVDEVPQEDEEE